MGGGALVKSTNKGAHGDGNGSGGEGTALGTDARRNNNKNSNVQGDPAPAPTLGKEMAYGTDEAEIERRQTTPNTFTNERCRCTGGNGVTRGNTITILTKGRLPGQCDKPTEREWCDKRRHRAEP